MAKSETEQIRLLKKRIEQYEKEKVQDRKEKARDRTERMQYRKEIREYEKKSRQDGRRHERDQERIGQMEQRLDAKRRMWPATWDDDRRSTDNATFMHRPEVLEDIICGGSLQSTTSMDRRQFDHTSDRFTELAKKHTEGAPVFRGLGRWARKPVQAVLPPRSPTGPDAQVRKPNTGAACGILWHRPGHGIQVPQVLRHDTRQDTAHAGRRIAKDTKHPHDRGAQGDRPGSDRDCRRHARRHTVHHRQGVKKGRQNNKSNLHFT